MERLLIVGLDQPEYADLRSRVDMPSIAWATLPKIVVDRGTLLVERPNAAGSMLPVSRVIYHGIFEDDFDFITALAVWGGPCLPDALGMMDCRLKLPCLARALRLTRFGSAARGFAVRGAAYEAPATTTVAKWGNWHCGENKERFTGRWEAAEATVFEPFLPGQAVRIMIIGDQHWQIRLAGEAGDWKQSIHPDAAAFMDVDRGLPDDTRHLQRHFGLEVIGVDYILADDGGKHLLEVNHIPNVTRFPEIRAAFLNFASQWVRQPTPSNRSLS